MKTKILTVEWCFKYYNASLKPKKDLGYTYVSVLGLIKSEPNKWYLDSFLSQFKLILRPLSSFTNKEKKAMRELVIKNFTIQKSDVVEADYLRSINIDIDNLKKKEIATYE